MTPAPWRLELLGWLRAERAGVVVSRFRTRKVAALLGWLAHHRDRSHAREALIEMLWPGAEPARGRNNLSQALSALRHDLSGPGAGGGAAVLEADRTSVRLAPAAFTTDVADLEAAARAAGRAAPGAAERLAALERVLSLYRGELLPGFYEPWVLVERERLRDAFLRAALDLMSEHERRGADEAAIEVGRRALGACPEHEEVRRRLARLEAAPAPAPPESFAVEPSRFFGREAEVAWIGKALRAGARLLTITGPAGTGKTRLAIEAVRRLAGPLGAQARFVGLADLSDARLIPEAILDAVGPRTERGDALELAAEALGDGRFLLVLDNFERLVDGGAPLIARLLRLAPDVACVVTSQRRLGLAFERELALGPLPDEESVRLFADRSRAMQPDFEVTEANAPAIAEICARLERIPLALELAAGRAHLLSAAQMLERLGTAGGRGRRLELLAGRRRPGAPARHATMRAALDWSFDLLSRAQRTLFTRLSVFRGGFTAEAAEAVAGPAATLDRLAELRECSLLHSRGGGPEVRFRFLETVREYAADRLAPRDRSRLQRRHAERCLDLAERAGSEPPGAEGAALARLGAEPENLRAALDFAASAPGRSAAALGLRLAAALLPFWYGRGHFAEGRRRIEALLARAGGRAPGPIRSKALGVAGALAWAEGEYPEARRHFESSLALRRRLGDRRGAAHALNNLGLVAWAQGELERAGRLLEEALAMEREAGDPRRAAHVAANLGLILRERGDLAKARALFEEQLETSRTLGERLEAATALMNLAQAARDEGDLAGAGARLTEALAIYRATGDRRGAAYASLELALLAGLPGLPGLPGGPGGAPPRAAIEESLRTFRELGERQGTALALRALADARRRAGDAAAARPLCRESLEIARRLGDRPGLLSGLGSLAAIERAEGRPRRAAHLLGAAAALRDRIGAPLPPVERADHAAEMARLREALGERALAAAVDAGRALSWEEAAAEALGERISGTRAR